MVLPAAAHSFRKHSFCKKLYIAAAVLKGKKTRFFYYGRGKYI
jgi:hypothetical protein